MDLEATPLQIKTDSALGSEEWIMMRMFDKGSSYISTMGVRFSSTMNYAINDCFGGYTDLPMQPPVEADKIWTITKTETALIITCNDVEVVNYLFADSSNSNCAAKWGGDVVEQIKFHSVDKASDFYRAGKGLN